MPYAECIVARGTQKSRIAGAALAAAVWLGLLILPGSASAVIWLQGATSQVYVSAAAGPGPEDDDVTVSAEVGPPAMYVFSNPAGVTAFSPCVLRSPTEGACPAIDRTRMTVELGNGRNRFRALLSEVGEGFSLRTVYVTGGRRRTVYDFRGLPPDLKFAQALGGRGPDLMIAGPAKIDRMNGALGNDRIIGNRGRDVQKGGPGADVLIGRGGPDLLNGGGGFDLLRGGGGFDRAEAPVTRAERRRARSIERFG